MIYHRSASLRRFACLSLTTLAILTLPGEGRGAAFRTPARAVTPGLQGSYWGPGLASIPASPGVPAGSPSLSQVDAVVDFGNNTFPGGFSNADMFVCRWTGFVRGPVTGPVTFFTSTDDGVELLVNTQSPAVISNWTDHGTTDNQGNVDMVQGIWFPLQLTFYERGGGAEMHLSWSYAGQSRIVVPGTQMSATSPPPPLGPTLSISTPQNFSPLINLSWTAVPNASSYNVFRSSQSGAETPLATVSAPKLTFADTNVVFWGTYFYVVNAVIAGQTSVDSNEVSGVPQPLPKRTTKSPDNEPCGFGSSGPPEAFLVLAAAVVSALFLLCVRRA